MEVLIGGGDEDEDASMQVNVSSDVFKVSQAKKAKLSAAELIELDNSISGSLDLPHKIPVKMRTRPEDEDNDDDEEDSDVSREKTNMYGVNFECGLRWG